MPSDERLISFLKESNRIEGITEPVTPYQLHKARWLLYRPRIETKHLTSFVSAFQRDAVMRTAKGMNVRVGDHIPPGGGPLIKSHLEFLLDDIKQGLDPYIAHCRYETLHPFTDCNGRSGRILWAWQMVNQHGGLPEIDFLHWWYYASLDHSQARGHVKVEERYCWRDNHL